MLAARELFSILPLIVVGSTAVLLMLVIAWQRHHTATALISSAGLIVGLLCLPAESMLAGSPPLMQVDGLAIIAGALILLSALVTVILSHQYLVGYIGPKEEFYLLLLCATSGALALVAADHLAMLFIGLELLSMPLYGMLAYSFRAERSLEAGMKYLLLSATATAFLLFGMALIYARTGTLDLGGVTGAMVRASDAWMLAGAALIVVGLGFKLSVVPFHLWTPDVYQGGPAPATIFLATVSKLAVFVVLLRLALAAPVFQSEWMQTVITVLALLTMLGGNLLALFQANLKRLLGYSSVAHFGYLLVAIVAGNALAIETTGVYLVTYLITTLAAFGVVTMVSSPFGGEDADALPLYRGLFWRRPYLAAVMTVSFLSLAGIPLTAGFIGKFYVIALGVSESRWWLVGGIVAGSAIGLYYYLRVMVTLYLPEPGMPRRDAAHDWGSRVGGLTLIAVALAILVLGVYPTPMIDWIQQLSVG
ncbi:proton-translocating NADH-quinone oxidoreductase subunit N [Marinobacter santoriniensis NKSG1]|uniref:NADH-quinone oxidoreductase subunit N n=1 Tax=Marinobacter santoriniensis NKSG1 TaxID=1288826 RepID=M7CNG1_9GAMM|nr:NADH-quinone oxidoreductase subunit NuoN [Marinobacter santoriniensis]EMP54709.1 proton-translocating NADH-quinone oxidoreductase subunit N [Marinobacter santoriniensis NKSG1]